MGLAHIKKEFVGRDNMDNKPPIWVMAPFALMIFLFFACIILSFLPDLFYFDINPASGSAQGMISYQEKSGWFQMNRVCWKDTQYDYCEFFDAGGKKFDPGRYKIDYYCTTFAWAWEKASECTITNATRIGDIN